MATVSEEDIRGWADKYGVPQEIALAVWDQESKKGLRAGTSSKNASGDMQVTPIAFKDSGVQGDPNDPRIRAEAGVAYLAKGYKKTNSVEGTAAFYHAGPNFQQKLQDNPDLNDGHIKTTDYAKQVREKVDTLMADGKNASTGTSVTDAPTSGNSDPGLASSGDGGNALSSMLDAIGSPYNVAATAVGKGVGDVSARVKELYEQAQSVTNSVISSAADQQKKIEENLKSQMQTTGDIGELQATVGLEAFRQKQERAAINGKIINKLDINDDDANSIIATAGAQMAQDFKDASALRAEIIERKKINFFDDPAGWIQHRFTLNSTIREHNQLVNRIDANEHYVEKARAFVRNAADANALKYTETTAAGAAAAAEVQRKQAQEKVLQIQDKLNKESFTAGIQTLAAINTELNTLERAQTSEQNRGVSQDKQAAKEDADRTQKLLDKQANLAATQLGYPGVQGTKDLQKLPPNVRAAIQKFAAVGVDGGIANGPLEAAEILGQGDPKSMPDGNRYMRTLLSQVKINEETKLNENQEYRHMNKLQQREALDEAMRKAIDTYRTDPTRTLSSTQKTNPFGRPTPETMETNGDAANLKITKLLSDQRKVLGSVPVTDDLIANIAFAGIAGGTYADISEAAKDVASYYRASIAANNATLGFDKYGLLPQSNFKVAGTDYSDYASVVKKMLKIYGQQSVGGIPGFEGLIPNVPPPSNTKLKVE